MKRIPVVVRLGTVSGLTEDQLQIMYLSVRECRQLAILVTAQKDLVLELEALNSMSLCLLKLKKKSMEEIL